MNRFVIDLFGRINLLEGIRIFNATGQTELLKINRFVRKTQHGT